MAILTLNDLQLDSKRVLLRVDFNVPMDKQQQITDDSRIRAALPTIQYILDKGGSLILMSHLGRPNGKDPKLSLEPIAKRLSDLLGKPVLMAPDCVGPAVEILAQSLQSGQILMLENLRFHEGEEEPEKHPEFVKALAKLGQVYVNDAFGTAHRAHASTAFIAHYFPKKSAVGFLMEKEIQALSPLLHNPSRPFHAIIGGAKISTKAGIILQMLEKVDALYIGGAMSFPFFKAQGISMGAFAIANADVKIAKEIMQKAKCLYLPTDLVITDNSHVKTILVEEGIPDLWQGMDIGPKTVQEWSQKLSMTKTIFWNGPLGVFEKPEFAQGTRAIAEMLAGSSAQVTVGGGDSVAAMQQMNLGNKFFHLSTGGGASLEYLEYGQLPGIESLSKY